MEQNRNKKRGSGESLPSFVPKVSSGRETAAGGRVDILVWGSFAPQSDRKLMTLVPGSRAHTLAVFHHPQFKFGYVNEEDVKVKTFLLI